MKLHSINTEQRLYVMPSGQGFSCYGFDVLDRKARAVAHWMANDLPYIRAGLELGTREHFEQCARIMDAGAAYAQRTGKRCNAELCPQLVGLEGQRVEVTYPDGQKARFYVGKSGGWMPRHLEIKTRRSIGGGSVYMPEGSTVRVVTTRSK
jgi:hypothetical protein